MILNIPDKNSTFDKKNKTKMNSKSKKFSELQRFEIKRCSRFFTPKTELVVCVQITITELVVNELIDLAVCLYRLNAPPGLYLRTKFLICYVHSLFNRVLAHGVDRFLERLALEALLHRLPFSVTGLFGTLWRWRRDVQTRFLHLFICGVYPLLLMEFTL